MTSHKDTFAQDNLPPLDQWPEIINLRKLGYPEQLNCAVELLDKAIVEGYGDCVVLRAPGLVWTYRELKEISNRIAQVLTEDFEMVIGERVLLHGPNNPMLVACWFGIVKAGGIVVATMPLLRAKELSTIVEKAQVRLALCDHRVSEEVAHTKERASVLERIVHYGDGNLEHLMSSKSVDFEPMKTSAEDIVLIGFTSGTTGVPKGTMHFHRDVMAICDTFSKHILKPRPDDLFIGSPPLAFTFGLGGLTLFPMHARAATLLIEKAPPAELCKAIEEHKVTVTFTSPTGYRFMLDAPQNLTSLRRCVSAGETLPKATSDAWFEKTGIRIIDGIGSTEILHIFISADGDDIRPGSTGKPVPLYEAKVIDEAGNELPRGEVGRLAVRGPTGCRYLRDDRQLEYVQHGWNITGDAYVEDEDGYFWFQARTDDMILSSGYNIAGPEVECALMMHPSIKECAVVGAPDHLRGNIIKAYIVLKEPCPPSPEELVKEIQEFVKAQIAPYKYPRAIEFVNELPKTESGKIQRFKLRETASA